MDTKYCKKCDETKPVSEFTKRTDTASGYRAHCKLCANARNRAYNATKRREDEDWRQSRNEKSRENATRRRVERREYVAAHLRQNPCLDCGEPDIVVLEFDHVRGEKVKEIAYLVHDRCSLAKLQEEMDKCEVVCANCHRRRSAQRAGNWHRLSG